MPSAIAGATDQHPTGDWATGSTLGQLSDKEGTRFSLTQAAARVGHGRTFDKRSVDNQVRPGVDGKKGSP